MEGKDPGDQRKLTVREQGGTKEFIRFDYQIKCFAKSLVVNGCFSPVNTCLQDMKSLGEKLQSFNRAIWCFLLSFAEVLLH